MSKANRRMKSWVDPIAPNKTRGAFKQNDKSYFETFKINQDYP